MRRITTCLPVPLAALALAACIALPGQARAEDKSADDLAREGLGKIVSALEMLIATIPTYEMPEVLPNGDIIIRRRDPDDPRGDEGGSARKDDDGTPKPI